MALVLKCKKRDVIRIGDVLVAVDLQSANILVVIDAPRHHKIVKLPNGMNEPLRVLRKQLGMKPTTVLVSRQDADPAA